MQGKWGSAKGGLGAKTTRAAKTELEERAANERREEREIESLGEAREANRIARTANRLAWIAILISAGALVAAGLALRP